jgi:tRNA dimethylallyltransferase
VGKTALAIELAKALQTKIISADSRQCYQELNIGVAKPNIEELETVHHYFINSHSIQEEVTAAVFEQYALLAAQEIFASQSIAIMVGGTGLYIKAFCEGLDTIPTIDANIRHEIITRYELKGLQWLQNTVQEKDPTFWENGEVQNPQRLMRALEVITQTGKSITFYHQQKKIHRPFNIIKVGLQVEKALLHERINNRVDAMMTKGLLEEVKELLPFQQLNALQTVGYQELFDYFNGKISLQKAVEQIKLNTRHYAKRQITWFKKDVNLQWITPNSSNVNSIIKML